MISGNLLKRLGRSSWRMVLVSLGCAALATACRGTPATSPTKSATPLTTAETPADELIRLTVTFAGDQCVYQGLESVPAGKMWLVLDVSDQTAYAEYGFSVLTVDQGKTLADLVAAPFISHEPTWAHEQAYLDEVGPGTAKEKQTMLVEGPFFLVCAVSDGDEVRKTNVVGPIAVVQKTK